MKDNNFARLGDFKGTAIEKAYGVDPIFDKTNKNDIEKAAHQKHKYLKIENGKYIYDHSQMTKQDHLDASEIHIKYVQDHASDKKKDAAYGDHFDLYEKHKKLAKEKSEKEKITMNNLDWGKSTSERNENLDKYDSLKTDKEKEDFLKKLKTANNSKGEIFHQGGKNPDTDFSKDKKIGKTRSGKDIYQYKTNPAHKDFTKEDIEDYRKAFQSKIDEIGNNSIQKSEAYDILGI